jgi:DNA repair ATPase RecN
MYNSLYYIFTKDYTDEYSNSTLYLKEKISKLKILYESRDKELKYTKKKYEALGRRYNDLEWKYNELLLNTHYNREYYRKLEGKYNSLLKKHSITTDNNGDIQCINDDYEHI